MTRRVLVVDDDTVSRLVMARMVTRLGYQAVQADDVADAVDRALDAGDTDLVLSDYCLPGGTGLDLLGRLRGAGVDAPFVLITGVAEVAGPDGPAGTAEGVAARLTKPVDSRGLAACLTAVLPP